MSAGHFSRQFRLAYGESPYSYLMTRRVERAMALLRRGVFSVTEVCSEVGCSSLGTFSTRFTELVGVPSSVYRLRGGARDVGAAVVRRNDHTRPHEPVGAGVCDVCGTVPIGSSTPGGRGAAAAPRTLPSMPPLTFAP